MKVLSLPAATAQLAVTRQPHDFNRCHCDQWGRCLEHCATCTCQSVVRVVTLPEPHPELVGQRIAIAADATVPDPWNLAVKSDYRVGSTGWRCGVYADGGAYLCPTGGTPIPVHPGHIVGSATVEACLPIDPTELPDEFVQTRMVQPRMDGRHQYAAHVMRRNARGGHSQVPSGLADQLPFSDFSPGRHALILTDAAPTTERCPWCWDERRSLGRGTVITGCEVCSFGAHRAPIPWSGEQLQEWQP